MPPEINSSEEVYNLFCLKEYFRNKIYAVLREIMSVFTKWRNDLKLGEEISVWALFNWVMVGEFRWHLKYYLAHTILFRHSGKTELLKLQTFY